MIVSKNKGRVKGFTLLELMISVAVVGILASIAYPSYIDNISRANRSEGQRELLRLASLQEQYFIDHRAYTTDMKKLGASADPYITDSGFYSIDAVVVGVTYTLKATARGTQATNDSSCLTLSVTDSGQKTATSTNCWE
ncbi:MULTISPECIES: type IV pilin protein [unclassified Colwellia]|uniref:type IV pilin protein n=1 Tax=unclassified Colwellia TaxID=196834 RepID=UPI0015F74910|nr:MULTISPECIES: type IV pilin protein [unclassified Colwellia]MBA6362180.1 prepilin-type N-terminal cleavage/methylation domain-containing protein [Colwellia sp. BRX8-8]MBA6373115.1 prepilin-type N-terminal cleavage/methylation domain-containing protein [Colwellia sp. BRX8-4]MBA6381204.1 prepilin-type N-terminal cleavage/methylation domain-containing protein [Colwellia sp. BRX10-7]MBA6388255.1 prepilin-type N-terminal cleavage/methylation domain-containing protein [Colwellia sp. BRX10-2]MBA64